MVRQIKDYAENECYLVQMLFGFKAAQRIQEAF